MVLGKGRLLGWRCFPRWLHLSFSLGRLGLGSVRFWIYRLHLGRVLLLGPEIIGWYPNLFLGIPSCNIVP